MRLAAHHRLSAKHGSRATDSRTGACEQRSVAVHLEQSAEEHTQRQSADNHQAIHPQSAQANVGNILNGKAEAIEHDTGAKHLLGADFDARRPLLRHKSAKGVGINHA